jgi:hypothetical protein
MYGLQRGQSRIDNIKLQKALRCKVAISRDSQTYYERMSARRKRTMDERIFDQSTVATASGDDEKTSVPFTLVNDLNGLCKKHVLPHKFCVEINTSMIRRVSIKSAASQLENAQLKNFSCKTDDNKEDCLELEINANDEDPHLIVGDDDITNELATPVSPPDRSVLTDTKTGSERGAPVLSKGAAATRQTSGDGVKLASVPPQPAPSFELSKGPDNQTLLRLLEAGEELQSMFRCARIQVCMVKSNRNQFSGSRVMRRSSAIRKRPLLRRRRLYSIENA